MKVHYSKAVVAAAAVAALAAAGCGKQQAGTEAGEKTVHETAATALKLPATTPAAAGQAGDVTWATYRPVLTVDPIQAYDYPENTAVSLLCESVLRQQPDGTIADGLTTATQPDDKSIVLTVKPGATFWDGKPVTAGDVAYSLNRNLNPKLPGLYGLSFDRVASITASGDAVTIALEQPDAWLEGELSQMAGVVVEKAYVEAKGKAFGTPEGGTMCTGAYKLSSWKSGDVLKAVANASYWGDAKPQARSISLRGVPDEATLTSGLLTGAIDGYYSPGPLGTVKQLSGSAALKVYAGPSFATDMMAVTATSGPLADAAVRRALSQAIDRQAYLNSSYKGNALLPRTLANPGTWGYGRDVFQADWDKLPEPAMDVAAAKAAAQSAGVAGKTITIATSQELPSIAPLVTVVQTAAEAIGLKVKLKNVSAATYVGLFTDPKARAGIDAFPTINYPDYADPAALYKTMALPGGSQNFSGYANAAVTKALDQARSTADPEARAKLVAQAGDAIAHDLPWIPLVAPKTVLVLNADLTGAASSFVYMGGPWADGLGAAK